MYSYVGVDTFKARLGIPVEELRHDVELRAILESVARQFDEHVGRTFRVYTATRYYTPWDSRRVLLDADLLTVTTLKTDEDGDRIYEVTWATTDYDLRPDNAAVDKRPYWELAITPDGNYSFPRIARGVQLVGKWGWCEELVTATTVLAAAVSSTTATAVKIGPPGTDSIVPTEYQVGQTIVIDSEQMYITAITPGAAVADTTLTVERGVNGTTAATHVISSVIKYYRYPYQVEQAALIHGAKLWTRRGAGYAERAGFMDTGQVNIREGLDWAVMDLLAPFQREVA